MAHASLMMKRMLPWPLNCDVCSKQSLRGGRRGKKRCVSNSLWPAVGCLRKRPYLLEAFLINYPAKHHNDAEKPQLEPERPRLQGRAVEVQLLAVMVLPCRGVHRCPTKAPEGS